mmetsp:Transcript_123696/g.395787  ORF Transcript_123696/g.395787 Transcript_123696/m.395787 type:complete len:201 (-) Transcript_123696:2741-3343(-)
MPRVTCTPSWRTSSRCWRTSRAAPKKTRGRAGTWTSTSRRWTALDFLQVWSPRRWTRFGCRCTSQRKSACRPSRSAWRMATSTAQSRTALRSRRARTTPRRRRLSCRSSPCCRMASSRKSSGSCWRLCRKVGNSRTRPPRSDRGPRRRRRGAGAAHLRLGGGDLGGRGGPRVRRGLGHADAVASGHVLPRADSLPGLLGA